MNFQKTKCLLSTTHEYYDRTYNVVSSWSFDLYLYTVLLFEALNYYKTIKCFRTAKNTVKHLNRIHPDDIFSRENICMVLEESGNAVISVPLLDSSHF